MDPQTLHAETFEEVSDVIERDADRLIELWAAQACQEQASASGAYRAEMLDKMPGFLKALAASLRSSGSEEWGPHRLQALEHGEQRWASGWRLSEVVRDYQILRLVLMNHLSAALQRPLSTRESLAIGLLLDEAIGAAVVMYTAYHERQIGESERQFREIMNCAADGILMVDREGNIGMLNVAAEQIFGSPADDLLNRDFRTLVSTTPDLAPGPGDSESPSTVTWPPGRDEYLPARRQVRGRRRDGSVIELELGIRNFHRADQPLWIVTVYEVTEQRRLENELKAKAQELEGLNRSLASMTEQAEASNQAKSAFLADISHEIRTPMTAILGYVELIRMELKDATQLQNIETIKRNADFLLQLMNDILDLSKIEARKFEVERVPTEPAVIVAEVSGLMAVRAASKNVPLVAQYEGPIPERIVSDPIRLRQILINLVGNAIKFTDHGQVTINVSLRGEPASNGAGGGAEIVFAVSDTGIGISADEQARVFEPFLQVEGTLARRPGGTGLGLTISKHLAEALGGRIELDSRPGEGSTFRLALPVGSPGVPLAMPAAHDTASLPVAPAAPVPATLGCRILAADDRRDNRILIAAFLRKAGATVTLVDNGRLAVDLVSQAAAEGAPFDVVLMDMQMPDMDGYQATSRLRAAGHRMPIIALTASAMKGDHQKCLEVGCDAYLPKPIDFAQLIATIARHLPPGDGH